MKKNYNVFFWNCNGKDCNCTAQNFIAETIKKHNIDILCLAESKEKSNDFAMNLNNELRKKYFKKTFICIGENSGLQGVGKIRILSSLHHDLFTQKRFNSRFLMYTFDSHFDLCVVHLKSMVKTPPTSKVINDLEVIEAIKKADLQNGINLHKFIIGDFNATPYSHSLSCSKIFNTIKYGEEQCCMNRKRYQSTSNRIYINPCWKLFSNGNVHGTYVYENESDLCIIENSLLDQVIFDSELLPFYDDSLLQIVTVVPGHQLLEKDGTIKKEYGDHLPIIFSIRS